MAKSLERTDPTFTHQPLLDPERQIRLLKLHRGKLDSRICCDIEAFELEHVPA
jgi:hypothetical protein